MIYGCRITDADMVRGCAPEQPSAVEIGQRWMHCESGETYPVRSVRDDAIIRLGSDSCAIVLSEACLRARYVCVDAPGDIGDIRAGRRYEFLIRCNAGHEVRRAGPGSLRPVEGEQCYECDAPVTRWWFRRAGSKARWSTSARFRQ